MSMTRASLKDIKQELKDKSHQELIDICTRLCRFKKENKELLGYLLFEAYDKESYLESVKVEIDARFRNINQKSPYYVRKSMRSILQSTRTYARYTGDAEIEIELLIHFCARMKEFDLKKTGNKRLAKMYQTLVGSLDKKISVLHEDLQYDHQQALRKLEA